MNSYFRVLTVSGRIDTARGAPVSDPARIQKHPKTRRIGDRRSALPVESGPMSRSALWPARDRVWLDKTPPATDDLLTSCAQNLASFCCSWSRFGFGASVYRKTPSPRQKQIRLRRSHAPTLTTITSIRVRCSTRWSTAFAASNRTSGSWHPNPICVRVARDPTGTAVSLSDVRCGDFCSCGLLPTCRPSARNAR